jgi:hypothetical protein
VPQIPSKLMFAKTSTRRQLVVSTRTILFVVLLNPKEHFAHMLYQPFTHAIFDFCFQLPQRGNLATATFTFTTTAAAITSRVQTRILRHQASLLKLGQRTSNDRLLRLGNERAH